MFKTKKKLYLALQKSSELIENLETENKNLKEEKKIINDELVTQKNLNNELEKQKTTSENNFEGEEEFLNLKNKYEKLKSENESLNKVLEQYKKEIENLISDY